MGHPLARRLVILGAIAWLTTEAGGCGAPLDEDDAADSDADSDIDGDTDSDADSDADPDAEDELFVSPEGSGELCTLAAPCQLSTARDRLRGLSPTMEEDLVVTLLGGTYELEAPIELTGELDSGKNGHVVIYRASPGETPILSGGRVITGFTLHDEGRNIYRAEVPAGLETRQLYVDGVRARRARGPLDPAGFVETQTGYLAPDGAMAGYRNPGDLEIVDLTFWKSFRCPVASITGQAITMAEPCWSSAQFHAGFDMGLPSWVENAYELLGVPGQFYLDRAESVLYYVPRAGEDIATAEVIAPALEQILSLTGTTDEPIHDVQLRGLTFSHATWLEPSTDVGYAALQAGYHLTSPDWSGAARTPGNVTLHNAQDVVIADCAFTHLGAYGLLLSGGSQRNTIEGNLFRDISSGGVQLADVSSPQTTDGREVAEDNRLANNVITDTGLEYHDSVGLFVGYARRTTITHNELWNLPYTAISVGWGWGGADPSVAGENRVTANLVNHAVRRLKDGGMIYTLSAQPDSAISANAFLGQVNVYGGIYLDQGSRFFEITDNVVMSAPHWYLLQSVVAPPAQDNLVQGNFTDTESAHCCGALGCCTDPEKGNTLSDNLVFLPGRWPAEAGAIMVGAGLEPAYRSLGGSTVRVEAEDYHGGGEGLGFHELTAGNAGGAYRDDGVDLYPGWALSNDVTLGWTQTGEWLAYVIDAREAGSYRLRFSVATIDDRCAIALEVDGAAVGSTALPDTGGYQTFQEVELSGVLFAEGPHLLRLSFTGGFNMDYFEYSIE